jgi:hypothetical protein
LAQLLPWRALRLAAAALVTLVIAAVYTLRLNPEIRFYKHAALVKLGWAEKLSREQGVKIIVCGGSSTAFSIDGERMLQQHGLPTANFGLHAGMEPLFLAAIAAQSARPGDTVVLALEPGLLMTPFQSPDLAAQMGTALRRPDLIHASGLTGEPVHWVRNCLSLRPGAYHFFTLLGKIALRKPLYRYAPEEVQASGWQRAKDIRPIPDQGLAEGRLCPDARRLLMVLKNWGHTNRVQVVYSLPWGWVTEDRLRPFQRMNVRFLREVAAILPVLKDPALGAYRVREHFSDSHWHLTAEGAAARSDSLAAQLKSRSFWSQQELEQLERRTTGGDALPRVPN